MRQEGAAYHFHKLAVQVYLVTVYKIHVHHGLPFAPVFRAGAGDVALGSTPPSSRSRSRPPSQRRNLTKLIRRCDSSLGSRCRECSRNIIHHAYSLPVEVGCPHAAAERDETQRRPLRLTAVALSNYTLAATD